MCDSKFHCFIGVGQNVFDLKRAHIHSCQPEFLTPYAPFDFGRHIINQQAQNKPFKHKLE